ncbi:glutamyl-tRNA reductase [Streptomyces sp. A7024]|uniref:Glutamyl-tRNA reductase n=1 Tax=Streptomyces coryli TaxID=1128680 RepID=A0A6G4U6X0_9ACTN|nr:glutamyl-tRNA reductase [Streptomyces coryli]NGN67853.1 glutamyl-tRNA reductase [Streptomyces coryli]
MSLLVVGLSHRSAPVSLLERVALDASAQAKLVQDAVAAEPVAEAAVLATCNRVELYADVEKFHAGVAEMSMLLTQHTGVGLEELTPYLYVHYEDRAVHHLFSVACGLDSMVVGEGQVLAQIKEALARGQELHTAGRTLNDLFQQALRVGKRAHSETGIDRAGQSLVTFGLEQLADGRSVTDWAAGKRALVIGAGSMSSLAAATLARAGVAELVVANRTFARAERLAASLGASGADAAPLRGAKDVAAEESGAGIPAQGSAPEAPQPLTARAVPMDAVTAELAGIDLLVSCTGAAGIVLTAADVAGAGRLDVLDLAMPRDVDGALHDLDGIRLVDIETLAGASADAPMAADVDQVRKIVSAEVAAFGAAQRAATITPTVVALRTMAADVVNAEIARLDGRLPDLGERERAEITQAVNRVVDKLLHAPTVRVKQLAATPDGAGYADALRKLFDLDQDAVAAVSRADAGGAASAAERGQA